MLSDITMQLGGVRLIPTKHRGGRIGKKQATFYQL